MLPALPTGTQSASSSPASASTSSNAAVFCPSIRNSLTEFTSAIGCWSASSRTSVSASSKFPRSAITARAVHQRLRELAGRDLALRDDHGAAQPGARRVRGGRRGRVAGRGADHGLRPLAHGRRDRTGHPAILERARRVRALELQPHLARRRARRGVARARAASSPRSATRPDPPARTGGDRGSARSAQASAESMSERWRTRRAAPSGRIRIFRSAIIDTCPRDRAPSPQPSPPGLSTGRSSAASCCSSAAPT